MFSGRAGCSHRARPSIFRTTLQERGAVSEHSNIRPVHGALWCDEGGVAIKHETSGSWATRTTDGRDMPSWRLQTLMAQISKARVLILKLDIEGAERQVCEASPEMVRAALCHDRAT
jgi:FkbM family methyltransferase